MSQLGVVTIGRNEGDRLIRCLESLRHQLADDVPIVYVDSGSTDGSVAAAQALGVEVVNLDLSVPFTAARARNAGFERLHAQTPELEFVQFVDGDCEVVEGWLEQARQTLVSHPDVAVVCGRRREKFPENSLYNRLCDIEWDTPIGEADACGGDAMMRVSAFTAAGGFNPGLIAGEEPELCVRLRQQGWKILRIDAEMTRHDAQMMRFQQWWKRSQRAGHAFAEGSWLHGRSPQRHWVRESRRIWLWGVVLPGMAIAAAIPTHAWSLSLLVGYPLSTYRTFRHTQNRGFSSTDAWMYALFCTLGKFPEAQGQFQFHLRRLLGRQQQLIEYKRPEWSESSQSTIN